MLATYQGASSDDVSASASRPSQSDTAKAAIANVLEDFVLFLEASGRRCVA